ncbi:hypothetical protein Cpin_2544 [Chitinophaga pinensis DSM 2588]|uniref:Uncharacterized protein n=1 Tax=Chitinophaga pinensis (strain ATCC 43595 / DSM 2588 / LMG 13176 / NBRC 15968 / NCIMB 11800 / UQM 2034) TaxID=485918 RepID=A0A979G3R5_CHIPD|nr:hypothetical protein Cpin_2544 [Chitinophaga pinensis DSM 2588]
MGRRITDVNIEIYFRNLCIINIIWLENTPLLGTKAKGRNLRPFAFKVVKIFSGPAYQFEDDVVITLSYHMYDFYFIQNSNELRFLLDYTANR